jgi:hypothetical protein
MPPDKNEMTTVSEICETDQGMYERQKDMDPMIDSKPLSDLTHFIFWDQDVHSSLTRRTSCVMLECVIYHRAL